MGASPLPTRGPLPEALTGLSALSTLRLTSCGLTGSIPDWLPAFSPRLTTIDLRFNALSGSIPDSLAEATGLVYLGLSSNWDLSAGVGDLAELLRSGSAETLEELGLGRSHLQGQLPSLFFTDFPNLRRLCAAAGARHGPSVPPLPTCPASSRPTPSLSPLAPEGTSPPPGSPAPSGRGSRGPPTSRSWTSLTTT